MNVIPSIPDMVGDGKIATGPTNREVGLRDLAADGRDGGEAVGLGR